MARHFPDIIDAYLEFTKGHEATPKIHLWSFLSVIAAAMERKVWLERGYYLLYPNLYVFIIGRSGLVKKSTTMGVAVSMLKEIPTISVMSERLTASSLISQLCSAQKKFEWYGQEIPQAPVFSYASELSVFMTEVFGSIIELLTTFYDPTDHKKPWIYKTVGKGTFNIHGPCLNLLGGSTQAWLTRCIPVTEMEGGFASRVIFVVENAGPKKLVAWPEVHPEMLDHRQKIVEDLTDISNMVGPMQVTDSAKKFFSNWYEHHMREVLPVNQDSRISGYMGRKGDTLLKLAMVRSASRSSDRVLTLEHLQWAGHNLELVERDMRTAFDVKATEDESLVWDIVEFVRNRRIAPRHEVTKLFSNKCSPKEIETALGEALEEGHIKEIRAEKDGAYLICYQIVD